MRKPDFSGEYLSSSFTAFVSSACCAFTRVSSAESQRLSAGYASSGSSVGSLTSTQPRSKSSFSSACLSADMASSLSFFIFTIAISAVHYPFHDKRGGLLKTRVGPRAH